MKTLKQMLTEMSEKELRDLLFPENEYKPLWRWMHSPAGKAWMQDYYEIGWSKRAEHLRGLVDWPVEEKVLRTDFNRFDAQNAKSSK